MRASVVLGGVRRRGGVRSLGFTGAFDFAGDRERESLVTTCFGGGARSGDFRFGETDFSFFLTGEGDADEEEDDTEAERLAFFFGDRPLSEEGDLDEEEEVDDAGRLPLLRGDRERDRPLDKELFFLFLKVANRQASARCNSMRSIVF